MAHIGVAPGSKLTDAISKGTRGRDAGGGVHSRAVGRRGRGDGAAAAAVAKRRSVRRREAPPRPPEGGGARRGAVARFVLPSGCFLNFGLSVVGRRGAARSMKSVNRGEGAGGFFVSSRRRRARRRRRERVPPGAGGEEGPQSSDAFGSSSSASTFSFSATFMTGMGLPSTMTPS